MKKVIHQPIPPTHPILPFESIKSTQTVINFHNHPSTHSARTQKLSLWRYHTSVQCLAAPPYRFVSARKYVRGSQNRVFPYSVIIFLDIRCFPSPGLGGRLTFDFTFFYATIPLSAAVVVTVQIYRSGDMAWTMGLVR